MTEKIIIPRLSVNDDVVTIGEWLVENGTKVKKGQDIVVYETTKETVEGQATADGYIHIYVEQGEEKEVGFLIATITDTEEDVEATQEQGASEDTRTYTKAAKEFVEARQLDVSTLPDDHIIRLKEVEALAGKRYQIRETHTNDLFIYGGGGFAKIIIELLHQTNAYQLKGIVDMKYPDLSPILNTPIIGDDEYLLKLRKMGVNKTVNAVDFPYRAKVYDKLKEYGFELPNLVHKTAMIEPSVKMGEGNLIFAGAMVGSEAILGNDCVINAGAIVNHDCIISDNCHIASGAILAGCVTVGENSMIGQGVTIYQRVTIGKNVVIQNGCHIFSDVPDGAIVKPR